MCGIVGAFGASGEHYEDSVRKMARLQAHRGPDDRGFYTDDWCCLGHRRLSILDPSPSGRQPFVGDEGRYALVFNGEIYNYRPLRDQLRASGYAFKSETDTEVLLYGLIENGPEFVRDINGDFAFGFYDSRARQLVLARDRFGVKPLYWTTGADGELFFASEIRPLVREVRENPRLDSTTISEYLAQQSVSPPGTLVEGVQMLRPGRIFVQTPEARNIDQYWDMLGSRSSSAKEATREEACKEVRQLLLKSIERQMVSDVPLGAFLSGGIDSSVIVGLMSKVVDTPIRTVCVGFEDERFHDSEYARLVADAYGADHVEVSLSESEVLELVQGALVAQDHPSADGINTYIVSTAARNRGLKVALSGLGGDELFGGYSTFRRIRILKRLEPLFKYTPRAVREFAGGAIHQVCRSIGADKIASALQSDGSVAEAYPLMRVYFTQRRIQELTNSDVGQRHSLSERLRTAFETEAVDSAFAKVSYAEATSYMHNVLLRDTDQMSMAKSLEVRVPFLDHELAEYVFGLSDSVRRPSNTPKSLLVDAVDGLLPEAVVHRKKQGFVLPFRRWMHGPLRDLCREGLDAASRLTAFRGGAVEQTWTDFLEDRASVSWSRIWLLVVLGHWVEKNL